MHSSSVCGVHSESRVSPGPHTLHAEQAEFPSSVLKKSPASQILHTVSVLFVHDAFKPSPMPQTAQSWQGPGPIKFLNLSVGHPLHVVFAVVVQAAVSSSPS